jgi:hypothetical protein
VPRVLCNLLRKKPSKESLPAGIGFAFSWSTDRPAGWEMARQHPCDTSGSVGGSMGGGCMVNPTAAGLPHCSHGRSSQEKGGARSACGLGSNATASASHVMHPEIRQIRWRGPGGCSVLTSWCDVSGWKRGDIQHITSRQTQSLRAWTVLTAGVRAELQNVPEDDLQAVQECKTLPHTGGSPCFATQV